MKLLRTTASMSLFSAVEGTQKHTNCGSTGGFGAVGALRRRRRRRRRRADSIHDALCNWLRGRQGPRYGLLGVVGRGIDTKNAESPLIVDFGYESHVKELLRLRRFTALTYPRYPRKECFNLKLISYPHLLSCGDRADQSREITHGPCFQACRF